MKFTTVTAARELTRRLGRPVTAGQIRWVYRTGLLPPLPVRPRFGRALDEVQLRLLALLLPGIRRGPKSKRKNVKARSLQSVEMAGA